MTAKKPQNVVIPSLATAIIALAENREVVTRKIEGLGEVGFKKLSVGLRNEWTDHKGEQSSLFLIQNTVCDPITKELVLQNYDFDKLRDLPTDIVDSLCDEIFKHNGFKTPSQIQEEMKSGTSAELKNSEADLN